MSSYRTTTIDLTPDPRIFTPKGVGAINIAVVKCLSELVANSLDWRKFNAGEVVRIKEELKESEEDGQRFLESYGDFLDAEPTDTIIRVILHEGGIEIIDNGIGMTVDELEIGLKLRAAEDARRVPLRIRKGMFGMGMKVGILGMGWRMTIRTRSHLEDNREHVLEIDTRQIEDGILGLRDIQVKTGPHDLEGPLGDHESGTSILVEDLHKSKHDPVTWREELGTTFAPEIEFDDVKIIVTDTRGGEEEEYDPCAPKVIDIIPDTKIDLDPLNLMVSPDHGDGTRGSPLRIRGWIGLRVRMGSGTGRWGLHTFRRGQLVEAFHNKGPRDNGLLPRPPHPTLARLHGEVHLDMCDPNFTKVGWNTELLSWSEAREKLEPYLDKMLDASRDYRVKAGGGEAVKTIQKFRKKSLESLRKLTEEDDVGGTTEEPDSENAVKLPDGTYLTISLTRQNLTGRTESQQFWGYSYREESKEMAVFVNTASTIWTRAKTSKDKDTVVDLIVNWAIVDSLYFCLLDDLGYDQNKAFNLRDEWMNRLYPPGGRNR